MRAGENHARHFYSNFQPFLSFSYSAENPPDVASSATSVGLWRLLEETWKGFLKISHAAFLQFLKPLLGKHADSLLHGPVDERNHDLGGQFGGRDAPAITSDITKGDVGNRDCLLDLLIQGTCRDIDFASRNHDFLHDEFFGGSR